MKIMWKYNLKEFKYAILGAFLYGFISWITNLIQFPIFGNDVFKPGIVFPIIFGIFFGPLIGFTTGLVGSIFGDLLSGFSFWLFQDIGFGLVGFISGFCPVILQDFRQKKVIVITEKYVLVSVLTGMLFVSVTEIWLYGLDLINSIKFIFLPAILGNGLTGMILTPLLMVAYSAKIKQNGDQQNSIK